MVYTDHKQLNISTIEQLGAIPGLVAKEWCVDESRVSATGHSDGGTASLMLAVIEKTKNVPATIAPSAAGVTDKDLEAYQCHAPIPVMIMHGKNDKLFPGWGAQTSAWWAGCNHCDVTKTKTLRAAVVRIKAVPQVEPTLYCEGTGSHRDWPNLNRVMLEFFAHPEKFL